jgi:quercetin dioxygenase-like cupin family protein
VNRPEIFNFELIDKDSNMKIDIPESNKIYITPSTGDLIIHRPNVWHGVSEHRDPDPRICFVFQLTAIKP